MDVTIKGKLEVWQKFFAQTHRPHRLAKDVRGNLYEFISYPYTEGDKVLVNARVPGDPTTIRAASCFELTEEGQDCMCGVGGEFYCKVEKAWRSEPVGRALL